MENTVDIESSDFNSLLMNETQCESDKSGHFIKCIFFCKFHAIVGPQIVTQVPNNYISKEVFDTISQYMIPKAQLQRCFVSVYVFNFILDFVDLLVHTVLVCFQFFVHLFLLFLVWLCFVGHTSQVIAW